MQNNSLQAGDALAHVKVLLSEMCRIKCAKLRSKSTGRENDNLLSRLSFLFVTGGGGAETIA